MTGFGRAQLGRGGVQVLAEIRALNQRFFELKLNLPRGWGEYEAEMRKAVQAVVE
ncbi:MAG: YicC/YloC family endoribonuclease, partial [Candidatus Binataceae bacterium]